MTNSFNLLTDIILEGKHDAKKILTDVRFVSDGQKKPVILFIHGFKGFKDWGHFNLIADKMAAQGFVFVKPNLSHNGTSPEHPTDFVDLEAFANNNFSIELDDIGTVIDYLFSEDCDVPASEMDLEKLFLMGHSRGGGLVLLKANEDPRIKGVTTWAAVSDYSKWLTGLFENWEKDEVKYIFNSRTKQNMPLKYQLIEDLKSNSNRLNIPRATKNLQVPLLVVHGSEDEAVSPQSAIQLHELNEKSKLRIIEGANHVFGGGHPFSHDSLPEHSEKAVDCTINFFKTIV